MLHETLIKQQLYNQGWPAEDGFNVILAASVLGLINSLCSPSAFTTKRLLKALDACPLPEMKSKYLAHAHRLIHFS
jgi:hypothetical protein